MKRSSRRVGPRRSSRQRGNGILLGVLAMLIAVGAATQVASSLTRQARLVRSFRAREVTSDLVASARVLAAHRTSETVAWRGPETLTLATGSVEIRRVSDGTLELKLRVKGGPVTTRRVASRRP